MTTEISCIIPAFNEAPRIARVLAALRGHPWLSQIIVVDDGSLDDTASIVAGFSEVTVVRMGVNRGKSAAVAAGIARAQNTLVMLLDADLEGLTPAHVAVLAEPVLSGRADATISLRQNAPRLWQMIGIDYISGERVFPKSILADVHLAALPGFGLEVEINRIWLERGLGIEVADWEGVKSPSKVSKSSWLTGVRADARMIRDILQTESPTRVARQIWQMRCAVGKRGD